MRLKEEQIEKLSKLVLKGLKDNNLATFKGSETDILVRVKKAMIDNFAAEDQLDSEVKQLMDQFRAQIEGGQLNERELFMKIKKEMAKKKKFVL